jgi:hypothetical protein
MIGSTEKKMSLDEVDWQAELRADQTTRLVELDPLVVDALSKRGG